MSRIQKQLVRSYSRLFLWGSVVVLSFGLAALAHHHEAMQAFEERQLETLTLVNARKVAVSYILENRLKRLVAERGLDLAVLADYAARRQYPEKIIRLLDNFDFSHYGLRYWALHYPERKESKWQLRRFFRKKDGLCGDTFLGIGAGERVRLADYFKCSPVVRRWTPPRNDDPFQFSQLVEQIYRQGSSQALAFGEYYSGFHGDDLRYWQPIWSLDKKNLVFLVLSHDKELFPQPFKYPKGLK